MTFLIKRFEQNVKEWGDVAGKYYIWIKPKGVGKDEFEGISFKPFCEVANINWIEKFYECGGEVFDDLPEYEYYFKDYQGCKDFATFIGKKYNPKTFTIDDYVKALKLSGIE
jgi:hypothetical protein